MDITLVCAMAENRVIGKANGLPWHLPVDLKRFKSLTLGHPMVMGRLTFDSIGKPLPGRTTIVVTRNSAWKHDGVLTASNVDEAIDLAKNCAKKESLNQVMIVGGAELYKQTIARATVLYVTEIHMSVDGDAYFPEIDLSVWQEHGREHIAPESENTPACSFVEYRRRVNA